MSIESRTIDFTLSELPQSSPEVGIALEKAVISLQVGRRTKVGNERIVLHPASERFEEPRFARFAVSLHLTLGAGLVLAGVGQLVVTGRRVIGLVTEGAAGQVTFEETRGKVCGFSFDWDDVGPPSISCNWRGKPTMVSFESSTDASERFKLVILDAPYVLKHDGSMVPSGLENVVRRIGVEGRLELLGATR